MKNFLFLSAVLLIISCSANNANNQKFEVICDVEQVNAKNELISTGNSGLTLSGGSLRTDKVAKSGKYSVMLSGTNKYAMAFTIKEVHADEYLKISVWRKSENKKGNIAVSAQDSKFYYKQSSKVADSKDGWDLVEFEAFIPPKMDGKLLKVYIWNQSGVESYYDDFTLIKSAKKEYPTFNENETFAIEIDSLSFKKLQETRTKAFERGTLMTDEGDYFNMKINYAGEKYKASARLKGDWLDHLYGDKWSYRIKLKKEKFWNNFRTFSIQTPISRDFLSEWVAHKLMEKEDLLTTRYGFIPVSVNGESKGVYAYEEHFEKQLIEAKNRREGPILKLDESLFWEVQQEIIATQKDPKLPYYYSSDVLPFVASKTLKTPVLYNEFLNGQTLLNQYKNGTKKASEVFDVVKMAKTYALYDITKYYHGLAWHNLRFYYNPVLCKLELISFDGYIEDGIFDWVEKPFLGKFVNDDISTPYNVFVFQCFNDSAFVENYYKYLKIYSSEEYLNKFFSEIKDELSKNETLLKKEFTSFRYDYDFIPNNAKRIRENLSDADKKVSNIAKIGKVDSNPNTNEKFYSLLIKVHRQDTLNGKMQIKIINYLPIDITIAKTISKDDSNHDCKKTIVKAFKNNVVGESFIEISKDSKWIVVNDDVKIEIKNWPAPAAKTGRDIYIENSNFTKYFTRTKDNKLVYKKSIKVVKDLIYIPAGNQVVFESGTEIDFINSGAFVSCSPLTMIADEKNPIIIKSSDKTGAGFSTIAADGKSELKNVIFDGLNTLIYHGWQLTGAVNFYESDVHINNCSFINNNCEDALNIVRSNFFVENSKFENIYADAFDSDFSTGKVDKCKFQNTNNDAIDFSGSVVEINNCEMRKIADKAVSGGEKSTLSINNIFVDGASFGLVSKDLSILNVNVADVNNCDYGILQLVKKPEYGPSVISASNVKINNCKETYLIEKGCHLKLNDENIEGKMKKLFDEFYK